MPKSLDQALDEHVKTVLENNGETIARIKSGLADGSLKAEDGGNDIIAGFEDELAAAREGRMRIEAVNDERLMQGHMEFTAYKAGLGWAGAGLGVGVETDGCGPACVDRRQAHPARYQPLHGQLRHLVVTLKRDRTLAWIPAFAGMTLVGWGAACR